MTVNEIVEKLAKEKVVEGVIKNITDGKTPDPTALNDLAQDTYMILLEKGDKVVGIYEEGHIMFYITRILLNQIISSSSPYYRNYIMPRTKWVEINDNILNNDG